MFQCLRFTRVVVILLLVVLCNTDAVSKGPFGRPDPMWIPSSPACSSICLKNHDYAVFGANMDWANSDAGLIYFNKRGLAKKGYITGSTGGIAHWTARYASITFNLVAYQFAWAGMNEKGLVFSTMSGRPWTTYEPEDERPALDSGHWFQYVLDTCETVDEVIEAFSEVRIITVDHYLVCGQHGDCAVIEFIGGRLVVHNGENLPVTALSNTAYEEAVWNWQKKEQSLPWSSYEGSVQRFVTAADRVESFVSRDTNAAVSYAFETLHSIRGEQYSPHTSQWSIVFDSENLRAYFRTARFPNVRYLDLARFDPDCDSPVKMLDIQEELSGDVSNAFFDFDYDISVDLFESFCTNWGIGITSWEIANLMSLFAAYRCRAEAAEAP